MLQSDQESYAAQQNAAKARRSFVIAELSKKGKVTFDVEGNSDTGYFIAENLKPQEAVKLVKGIKQGNIDLKELSEQGWGKVKGESTGFKDSLGELVNETTISVASGIVGGILVTVFGPVGSILLAGGMAAAEKTIQGNFSVNLRY